MTQPELPEGHKHLFTPARAAQRGYWLARDDKGYDYVVGHRAYKDGKNEVAEATDPAGNTRKWTREAGKGEWLETTASTCLSRWLDRVPIRLRAKQVWHLADGSRAAGKRELKEAIEKWCKNPDRGSACLCLWGPPGTGKSQAAVWAGMILAEQGVDGEWLHVATGAQELRRSYSGERALYDAQMQRWLTAPFLVADDLGSEIAGKDVAELLYRLADTRYNCCLPTIWTSNVSPMLLGESGVDPRTASRIGSGFAVEVNGHDKRKRRDIDG